MGRLVKSIPWLTKLQVFTTVSLTFLAVIILLHLNGLGHLQNFTSVFVTTNLLPHLNRTLVSRNAALLYKNITHKNGTILKLDISNGGKPKWHGSRTLYLEGHRGRLGNHMFQYAAAYGIARRTNSKVVMSSKCQLPRYFQGLTFPSTGIDSKTKSLPRAKESQPSYFEHRLIDNLPNKTRVHLCCFLESYRYFEGYEVEIRSQFKFKDAIASKAVQFAAKARSEGQLMYNSKNVTLVGIHSRRSDKAGKPGFGWLVPEKSYFAKAMKHMKEKYKNVYFILTSEDYNWCQQNIGTEGILYSPRGTSAGQDLAFLAECDHIIMSVGTMGWWAGWMAGGDVIYFGRPTVPGSTADKICNLTDLFPTKPNWIPMSN